jgi:hypothetical protein
MVVDELLRALDLERMSGTLSRRWLDTGGRESPVYDILQRHAGEDDRHGQTLWEMLVDRGVAPPDTPEVETPEDFPRTVIALKEELVELYDQVDPSVDTRERGALRRLRAEDDDQRALLKVYFPLEGDAR